MASRRTPTPTPPGASTGSPVGPVRPTGQLINLLAIVSVVADLLQNESVTSLVQKRKEKQGEDSGLESGHTSMNTGKYPDLWTGGSHLTLSLSASDTQSDSNSVGEDSHTADTVRPSQHTARNTDFGQTSRNIDIKHQNILYSEILLTSKYFIFLTLRYF